MGSIWTCWWRPKKVLGEMAGDVRGKVASDRRWKQGVTMGSHYDCLYLASEGW